MSTVCNSCSITTLMRWKIPVQKLLSNICYAIKPVVSWPKISRQLRVRVDYSMKYQSCTHIKKTSDCGELVVCLVENYKIMIYEKAKTDDCVLSLNICWFACVLNKTQEGQKDSRIYSRDASFYRPYCGHRCQSTMFLGSGTKFRLGSLLRQNKNHFLVVLWRVLKLDLKKGCPDGWKAGSTKCYKFILKRLALNQALCKFITLFRFTVEAHY